MLLKLVNIIEIEFNFEALEPDASNQRRSLQQSTNFGNLFNQKQAYRHSHKGPGHYVKQLCDRFKHLRIHNASILILRAISEPASSPL